MEHFVKATGYLGPISEFNFSYARPVEFYTIGWLKVGRKELSFKGGDVLKGAQPEQPDRKFYFFEKKVICPPRGKKYVNWSFDYENSRFWMAYDLESEFLWFAEELKAE